MSNHFLNAFLAAALALGAQAAFAQEKKPATTNPGQSMENAHAICIGCHGIPGYKTAFPSVYHVPKIAGQQAGYIVNALKAYKAGERSHPSMRGVAASLSEETMQELAKFYAGGGRK